MNIDEVFIKALAGSIANQVGDKIMDGLSGLSTGVYMRFGKEKSTSLIGYSIPASNEKRVLSLAGPGRIVGGNIIIEATDEPLHDMNVKIIADSNVIVNDTIYNLQDRNITSENLSAVYVVKYYEDMTSAGSWVTSATGNFKYTIGFSESYFDDSYEIYLKNSTTSDRLINLFMRHYYWGGK